MSAKTKPGITPPQIAVQPPNMAAARLAEEIPNGVAATGWARYPLPTHEYRGARHTTIIPPMSMPAPA